MSRLKGFFCCGDWEAFFLRLLPSSVYLIFSYSCYCIEFHQWILVNSYALSLSLLPLTHTHSKQVNALTHTHQTDLKVIKNVLADFKCTGCRQQQKTISDTDKQENAIKFKPIGWIHSDFPEKRAVPRQPSVCSKLTGYIEISKDVFNNPEHSVDKLEEFSHLWIIYHFHKNDAHAKAKVSPPRLCGERCGIFSTRSPHRPCPIGLSLVEIDRIDGRFVHFRGTDMVHMTPVLDIKPYIPRYDSPMRGCLIGTWPNFIFLFLVYCRRWCTIYWCNVCPHQNR